MNQAYGTKADLAQPETNLIELIQFEMYQAEPIQPEARLIESIRADLTQPETKLIELTQSGSK